MKSQFFEFFPGGSHREVLLLGEMAEQVVHWSKPDGENLPCRARVGRCLLCERAGDGEVGPRRVEFYAPTFVRPWKEKTFRQKVAVFTVGACEQILKLLDSNAFRGQRLDVTRVSQGSSSRLKVKEMPGLPAGFPVALPPAFDVLPFVRARYGWPADPANPMLTLTSFKCEAANTTGGAGRPRPLALTADDVDPAEFQKLKEQIGAAKKKFGAEDAAAAATSPTPEPQPEAAAESAPTKFILVPVPAAPMSVVKPGEPAPVSGAIGAVMNRVKGGPVLAADPEAQAELDRRRTGGRTESNGTHASGGKKGGGA